MGPFDYINNYNIDWLRTHNINEDDMSNYIGSALSTVNSLAEGSSSSSNNRRNNPMLEPLAPVNIQMPQRVQYDGPKESIKLKSSVQPDTIMETNDNIVVEGNELNAERIQTEYYKEKEEEVYQPVSNVDNDSALQPFVFFPHYKISDYSNDIINWRKQINPYGSKGFFFFKIFFNFRTNYGLLGGILNDSNESLSNTNTAYGYLRQIANLSMYKSENLGDRLKALQKFVNGLYVVSEKTPWFFKEVNNINNINDMPMIEEDFNNQSIDIICSEESVDMRLGTLFNLYKFACYNSLRNKEIIPANLRRFEMSILFMHVPLRIHQARWKDLDKTVIPEKELNFNKDVTQIMSVKMLTFQNCEFDVKSMNDVAEQTSNEIAFDLGKSTIKINYTRVFEHRINEWERFGFGQDGFIFDMSEDDRPDGDRLNKIASAIEQKYYAPRQVYNYDPNKIRNREGIPVGTDNYFGRNVSSPESLTLRHNTTYYNKKLQDLRNIKFNSDNLYGNFTKVRSIYYLNKLKAGKEGTIDHGNIYGADYGRTGIGQYRRNSDYLDEKLNRMKYGGDESNVPYSYATPNTFTLKWSADAINNSNNMYAVDGIPTTKHTWLGKLLEGTWQRIKGIYRF